MALKFGESRGEAQKSTVNQYKYVDGENRVRIVGEILARYVYWIKGENDKNIPMECLSFDRDAEAFTNQEKDWVREMYPDQNCGWSYATQCIDNGELKVINLKKKLWMSIIETADSLGDPTDPDDGWDIVFNKRKTGPHNFNVEYNLLPLKCDKRPLTDEERALLEEMKPIDEVLVRPTADAQKALLDRIHGSVAPDETDDETLEKEFQVGG